MLNLLGVVILLGGLGGATFIWCTAEQIERQTRASGANAPGADSITQPHSPEDSRRYTHDVELYYGETGLLMNNWRRWWEETRQGKPFAYTIAVTSLAVASGLLYVGSAPRPR